jgi:hypothetical protein
MGQALALGLDDFLRLAVELLNPRGVEVPVELCPYQHRRATPAENVAPREFRHPGSIARRSTNETVTASQRWIAQRGADPDARGRGLNGSPGQRRSFGVAACVVTAVGAADAGERTVVFEEPAWLGPNLLISPQGRAEAIRG